MVTKIEWQIQQIIKNLVDFTNDLLFRPPTSEVVAIMTRSAT